MSDNLISTQTQPTSASQTQEPTSQVTTPASNSISKEQVDTLIEKVRSDEKAKVYGKIEELNKLKLESEKQLKDLQDTVSKLQDEKNLKTGTIEDEVKALKDQNEKLKKAIDEVASSAAEKIRMSELKAYREFKIRESGVKLTELISGFTEEQIDTAIVVAKKREQEIEDVIRAELQKKLADQLPTPLVIDGSQGRGPSPSLSIKNRESVARLPHAEYEKRREQLLLEAKQKAGLV